MEISVSYSFYTKVSQEGIICEIKNRCMRDNQYIVPLQKCRNNSRNSVWRLGTSKCGNSTKDKYIRFYEVFKRKKYVDDIWRHFKLQSKWDKAFWARRYYVETIGSITDEAVQKYIREQVEDLRKEDSRGTAL